jgi:hypothetical protein
MITAQTVPSFVVGVLAGLCLVIACGDDGGAPIDAADAADAAACDCPAAEPPLPGRFEVRERPVVIEPNATTFTGEGCELGELLVGGGCVVPDFPTELALVASGVNMGGTGWQCTWHSTSPVAIDGLAQAFCLVPAP